MNTFAFAVMTSALWLVVSTTAEAQSITRDGDGTLSIVFRGTPLDHALERFSAVSGESLAYESSLVAGRTTYCVAEGYSVDGALRCILQNSGLDYFRLSSGTIVLAGQARDAPLYGYLTGVVRDERTGRPLPSANVRLDGLAVGSATNAGGTFVLPPLLPGLYQVRISHVAYHDWTGAVAVSAGSNAPATVLLSPRLIPVAPVVVDGAMSRLLSQELGVSTAEKGPGEPSAQRDIYAAAATLSGARTNDATAEIRVDGADAAELRFALDGAPVYLPRQSIGIIGPFSSLALDRITIHRAGYGVAPGSSLSGVLDAHHGLDSPWSHLQVDQSGLNGRLKLGTPDGSLAAMTAVRLGSWNVYTPSIFADVQSAWTAADPFLIVAPLGLYQYATDAFITDSLNLTTTVDPEVQYGDIHAAFDYRPSLLRSVSGSFHHSQRELSGGRSLETERLQLDPLANADAILSSADTYDWNTTSGQIQYSTFIGKHTLLNTQLFGSAYNVRHAYALVDDLLLPDETDAQFEAIDLSNIALPISDNNSIESAGLRLSLNHIRTRHELTGGVEATISDGSTSLRSYNLDGAREAAAVNTALAVASTRNTVESTGANVSAYVEDRIGLSRQLAASVGIRTTYMDNRKTVYGEPRVAFLIDDSLRSGIPVAARVALGMYRQFETQVDHSALNAGALLPSVRLWLPLDGSMRPPLSYHLSFSGSIAPSKHIKLAVNAFSRTYNDVPVFDYTRSGSDTLDHQSDYLTTVDGNTSGFDAELKFASERLSATARYAFVHTRRTGKNLFGGRSVSAPGNDPHRFSVEFTALPFRRFVVRLYWRSGWDRRWAFSPAYYNYFGHSEALRRHGEIDLGTPDKHALPHLHQLDLGLAYSQPLRKLNLQLRADMVNALGRANVASYRLRYDGEQLRPVGRPLLPRLLTLTARLSWRL